MGIETSPRESKKICFPVENPIIKWGYFYGFSAFQQKKSVFIFISRIKETACKNWNRIILFVQHEGKVNQGRHKL